MFDRIKKISVADWHYSEMGIGSGDGYMWYSSISAKNGDTYTKVRPVSLVKGDKQIIFRKFVWGNSPL